MGYWKDSKLSAVVLARHRDHYQKILCDYKCTNARLWTGDTRFPRYPSVGDLMLSSEGVRMRVVLGCA